MVASPKPVASADNLQVEPTDDFVAVSGSTTITQINGQTGQARAAEGQRLTLLFTGTLTVSDGANLKLSAAFSATPDDILELVYTGGNWYEIGRSNN
jgi:hypothetical protein